MSLDFKIRNRKFNVGNGLMEKKYSAIVGLIGSYKRLFNFDEKLSLEILNDFIFPIYTIDERSIFNKSNLTNHQNNQIKIIIDKLLKSGHLIKSKNIQWSSPVYPKLNYFTNELEIYCDYSDLNNLTYDFSYLIKDTFLILNSIPPSYIFTKIVLDNALHHLRIGPTQFKTSFTIDCGKSYEFTTLYNRNLKNASKFLQVTMENILKNIDSIIIYEDQILIYTDYKFYKHFEIIKTVFRQLRNSNLKINIENSYFLKEEITFLDHIINKNGYTVDQTKLTQLLCFPRPEDKYDLNLFIDSTKHFKQYINNYDYEISLIRKLVNQQTSFEIDWNKDIELAFDNLKIKLASNVPF